MWSFFNETQQFKDKIKKKLLLAKQEVTSNCGVLYKEELIKEYARYMGYIQALEEVIKEIEEMK